MESPRVFKKYANRRIYDTHSSRYVTLDELADTIRKGSEVQIIDAQSKSDVTAYILTQIVLEQAKRNNALMPTPMLHLIIQYGDNLLLEFFETYLQQIVRNYLQYKKNVDTQFRRWLDLGMGLSPLGGGRPEANPFATLFENPTRKPPSEED